MRQKKYKVEQIQGKKIVIDYDETITINQKIEILKKTLNKDCDFIYESSRIKIPVFNYGGSKVIILNAQVVYLGNPHKIYKKRIERKKYFERIFNEYKNKFNYIVKIIGIYKYKGKHIFVDYDPYDFFNSKSNNSSAHVYSNDLLLGRINGIFVKIDKKDNTITVIDENNFSSYLNTFVKNYDKNKQYIFKDRHKFITANLEKFKDDYQKIIGIIDVFNREAISFNKRYISTDCIREMRDNGFRDWRQMEWQGFYMEFLYSRFIEKNNLESQLDYIKNKNNLVKVYDFDLNFLNNAFLGDLKTSNIKDNDVILNDKNHILEELKKYKRLWYIVYEHKCEHDNKENDYPFFNGRVNLIREVDPTYNPSGKYKRKFKAKVKFKDMFIVEINKYNYKNILKEMSSNFHQYNHGDVRNPKFKFTKSLLERFIIYSYN